MQKIVTIYCHDTDSYKNYPIGITVTEILEDQNIQRKDEIVSVKVNNKSENMNFAIFRPKDIEFVRITTSSGMRVYVRTLCMVLSKAVHDLFPQVVFRIEHPLAKGYYSTISNLGRNLTENDISKIKMRAKQIIDADLPVVRHERRGDLVISFFKERGEMDKVQLLQGLNEPYSEYYDIDGYLDYYSSPLLLRTGQLNLFDFIPCREGAFIRIPSRTNPEVLEKMVLQPKMFEVFQENMRWNKIMGLQNVGDLNQAIVDKKTFDLIKIVEALQEKKVSKIADDIVSKMDNARFVLIAGPSSSGKTTFSKRLGVQLRAAGVTPIVISLDNYFVDRDKTPKDADGNYDFEALDALDVPFFNDQLKHILAGEEVNLPTFNFESGKRFFKKEDKVRMKANNIILMEGIHALNPALTPDIPDNAKYKIYVSALTTISLDNHNWIPTTDNRLLRRIIRDYRYRGYSAQDTISRWPSVRAGEEKWIFPFQENANVMFDSSLIFEIASLKRYVEPVLAAVPRNSVEYAEAHRLIKFLKYFKSISDREIPSNSFLREFVGGSSFRY